MAARLGAKHHFAKLDDAKVRAVRKRYRAGGVTILDLANEYDVSMCSMGYAISGRTWKHVTEEE